MPYEEENPLSMRLPEWLKVRTGKARLAARVQNIISEARLNTVCQSARCPNIGECFGAGTATFLLMGPCCSRNCGFCAVKSGAPQPLDPDEPARVAQTVASMGLSYVVLTSVTRDDLPDGGASHFAETIRAIKVLNPNARVEVLVPDFQGDEDSLRVVLEAGPHVFNHNVETVRRLQPLVRPQASYERSLEVLRRATHIAPTIPTKSGLMVGLGETDAEIVETLRDLVHIRVSTITIGQYLRPSSRHLPVHRFVHPRQFENYKQVGEAMGLKQVVAGPFVRSSYHAKQVAQHL